MSEVMARAQNTGGHHPRIVPGAWPPGAYDNESLKSVLSGSGDMPHHFHLGLGTCLGAMATIVGTNGDDVIVGGEGSDTFADQGNGSDTVYYVNDPAGVVVYLDNGIQSFDGNGAMEFYDNIENVYGSAFDDILYGTVVANRIEGIGGDDEIFGGDGNDLLNGGAGNDRIGGGGGADDINGNDGNDRLAGGAGDDDLTGGNGNDNADGGTGSDTCSAETVANC